MKPTKENKLKVDTDNKAQPSMDDELESHGQANEKQPKEYGGRRGGLDPTRYGDWEKNGRCIDF